MPPLAIFAGIAAAGSIGGALIGSSAAGKAADTQSQAANYAASLQKQSADEALAFQKQQWQTQLGLAAPWLNTGTSAINQLGYLTGLPQTTNPAYASGTSGGFPAAPTGGANLAGGVSGPQGTGYLLGTTPSGGMPPEGDTTGTGAPIVPTGTSPTLTGVPPTGSSPINTSLGGYGSLMQPWTQQFVAPTDVTEQNDPGFQFRLSQGEKAIQASAAAKGNLLTGGTAKALTRFGQDYASNEYNNVYNRALGQYQQGYNIFQQNQANQFNRLAALSGIGQTSAGQLSSAGMNTGNNVSNILLGSANSIGQSAQNAAAARASGYVGGANAWSGALGNLGSGIGNYLMLSQLLGQQGGGGQTMNPYTWGGL